MRHVGLCGIFLMLCCLKQLFDLIIVVSDRLSRSELRIMGLSIAGITHSGPMKARVSAVIYILSS